MCAIVHCEFEPGIYIIFVRYINEKTKYFSLSCHLKMHPIKVSVLLFVLVGYCYGGIDYAAVHEKCIAAHNVDMGGYFVLKICIDNHIIFIVFRFVNRRCIGPTEPLWNISG